MKIYNFPASIILICSIGNGAPDVLRVQKTGHRKTRHYYRDVRLTDILDDKDVQTLAKRRLTYPIGDAAIHVFLYCRLRHTVRQPIPCQRDEKNTRLMVNSRLPGPIG